MDVVKVNEIRWAKKPRLLRAFVGLKIGNMVVTDFRIFHHQSCRTCVEVPVTTWRDPESRELRFKLTITLPGKPMGRVQAEIPSCY